MAKQMTHYWAPKSAPFGEYVCTTCYVTQTDQSTRTKCPGAPQSAAARVYAEVITNNPNMR